MTPAVLPVIATGPGKQCGPAPQTCPVPDTLSPCVLRERVFRAPAGFGIRFQRHRPSRGGSDEREEEREDDPQAMALSGSTQRSVARRMAIPWPRLMRCRRLDASSVFPALEVSLRPTMKMTTCWRRSRSLKHEPVSNGVARTRRGGGAAYQRANFGRLTDPASAEGSAHRNTPPWCSSQM